MDNNAKIPPLLFPYHLGPAIRFTAPSLIYHGKLAAGFPAWPSGEPINTFIDVIQRANSKNHKLLPLLDSAYNSFNYLQTEAIEETKKLEGLAGKLLKVILIHPGTREVYDDIRALNVPDNLMNNVISELKNSQIMNIATTELMFRIYELMLESDNNTDKVLDYFDNRISLLGGPDKLLAECVINRITTSSTGAGAKALRLITNSQITIDILSYIGKDDDNDYDVSEICIQSMAFYIFEQIIKQYVPLLIDKSIPLVNKTIEKYSAQIDSMKKKCVNQSTDLYYNCSNENHLKVKLEETLDKMTEEVSEIRQINIRSTKDLFRELTEDYFIWTTFAGFIGSLVTHLSPAISASVAITFFSKLGTTALKTKRRYKDKLEKSPWSFVYYMR